MGDGSAVKATILDHLPSEPANRGRAPLDRGFAELQALAQLASGRETDAKLFGLIAPDVGAVVEDAHRVEALRARRRGRARGADAGDEEFHHDAVAFAQVLPRLEPGAVREGPQVVLVARHLNATDILKSARTR